jgi:quercetin dioxygenase-like cupin family protein
MQIEESRLYSRDWSSDINSNKTISGRNKMFKKIIVGISISAAMLLATTVLAEDAVVADPGHYTVEFENDRVRIIRVKYGPGEKSVMHTHGPNASVMLSNGTIRMHFPDESSEDLPAKTGEALWTDGDNHLPENVGDGPLEVILVELKD